jgi:hypothetical protein
MASFAAAWCDPEVKKDAPARSARYILLDIDVLVLLSSRVRRSGAFAHHQLRAEPHRFGKQNRGFDSPRRQMCAVLSGSVYFQ